MGIGKCLQRASPIVTLRSVHSFLSFCPVNRTSKSFSPTIIAHSETFELIRFTLVSALYVLRSSIIENPTSGVRYGSRPLIGLLITDGKSTRDAQNTIPGT